MSKLGLINGGKVDDSDLTPMEYDYKYVIEMRICEFVLGNAINSERLLHRMTLSEFEDQRKMLESNCVESIRIGEAEKVKGNILVLLEEGEDHKPSGLRLAGAKGESEFRPTLVLIKLPNPYIVGRYAGKTAYVFNSREFSGENEYAGMHWTRILDEVENEYGRNSTDFEVANRICDLCDGLRQRGKTEEEYEAIRLELKKLQLQYRNLVLAIKESVLR